MTMDLPSLNHIALVGGGEYCREILVSLSRYYPRLDSQTRITAVVDPDLNAPGMELAREMGLTTLADFHALYDPRYAVDLIMLLDPDPRLMQTILDTKPGHIRFLSYQTFDFFKKALDAESKQLRERSEEMETILHGIQDSIVVITPEMNIVEVNAAFLKQMGYSREEVIGRKCHEVFQKINRQCNSGNIVCPLHEALHAHQPSQQVLTRLDHNGELCYIEVTLFPIWDKDGRISKFIEISRDITLRKKEEEEITQRLEHMVEERTRQLRETHAKLLHQDKMASLGKLAASVVHEINNPIAGILNLILLIKRMREEGPHSAEDVRQQGEYLDLMETETRRISRIVSNLLSFSRQSKLELKAVEINRLIEKTLMLNANLLKLNRIQVEKALNASDPLIFGSEDQLQQVFMNLLSNAAEAMDPSGGGVLRISTGRAEAPGKIRITLQDNGCGIPHKNLSKLFEPFFTTKKKGKGVGLGLSVAYGIVKEHGGRIQVESLPGQGSTFMVELPVSGSESPPSNQGAP